MCLGFVVTYCSSCQSKPAVSDTTKVVAIDTVSTDTVFVRDTIRIYNVLEDTFSMNVADSLRKENKRLNEKLLVQEYKLQRIREYIRISGKGNNSKYLRGWILRVLNH